MLDNEGYFYNTQYDLQAGTGLGEKAQRTAISNLKSLNLIECKLKGLPAKRYFKIIADTELILKYIQKGKIILETIANSQDTSQGGNLKLPKKELDVADGSGNNTNINNTKEIIQKNLHVVLSGRKDVLFFEKLFNYYQDKYYEFTGEHHPRLTIDKVKEVVNNIDTFGDEFDICSLEQWQKLIDIYYRSNLDCDRNMMHFVRREVLYNRADNLMII
jgi:hypothetical protein